MLPRACTTALDRLIARRGTFLWLPAAIGLLVGYLPAARGLLRVEHWDYNYFYSTHPASLLDLSSLAKIAAYNSFYLFRFQAGPGLWHYALHLVLRDVPWLYLALNLSLHAANAVLLALWVGRWSGESGAAAVRLGAVAGCLFLLMPAPYESVVWTFFSYKVLHAMLLLGSLIAYERYAAENGPRWAALSLALLLVSYLFLEASLPAGLVMAAGLILLRPEMGAGRKAGFLLGVAATWALYAAMHIPCRSYALGALHMDDATPGFIASWVSGWPKMFLVGSRWALLGVGLGNSGLGLKLMDLPYHLYTVPRVDSVLRWAAVVSLWSGLAALSGRPAADRRLAFAAALAAAVSGVMLLGRFDDGRLYPGLGVPYLQGMSAYHYLPSLFLAAMLGRWIEAGLRAGEGGGRARALASLLVCILALYAQTLRGVTTEYVRIQEPTLRLVERVRAILAKDPGARVYVDHHLPQAPLNNSQFTDEIHTFHAFSLMFGERIMPVRSLATVIARASGEAPASRETAAQDARSLLQQAALFDWHGEHADAERYKRLAADLTPAGVTAAEELQKGISLHQQGRLDEAIARTLAAAALDPKLAQARFNLGVYFSEKGLLDEAIAHTRAALALDPGSVGAHFNLGYFLHTRGRLDEAEREYREALRLDPNAANARLNLGILLRSQGRAGLD